MNINDIVARNLIFLRKKANLTQQELAKAINYSDNAISRWERGEVTPSVETLEVLAKYYSVDIGDLLMEKFIYQDNSSPAGTILKRVFILLFSIMIVWLTTIISYIYIESFLHRNEWILFIAAVPVSAFVSYFYNRMWGNRLLNMIIWSIFTWSLILTSYLYVFTVYSKNVWLFFILGVPTQFSLILWYFIRKPLKKK